MNRIAAVLAAIALSFGAIGCTSAADKASDNTSIAAENFEVQRSIIGINGITNKVEFKVEGRCSIEGEGLGNLPALVVMCKHGPNEYRKHYLGLSDNVFFIATQMAPIDVSEYRTRIILKPQNLVPNLDLIAGEQP